MSARTVESLFRLAGLDEVARRVRPSSRRAGETEREGEPTEDGGTEGEASSETSQSETSQSEAGSSETESSQASSAGS